MSSASDRVRRQRASLYAFGSEALGATNLDATAGAAVVQIAGAVDAAGAVLFCARGDRIEVMHEIGFEGSTDRSVTAGAPSIVADALRQQDVVVRALDPADFEAAPYLQIAGVRHGAAVRLQIGADACVLAVFSGARTFDLDDLQTLRGTAVLLERAAARIHLQRQLDRREATLRALLNQLPAIVWTVDTDLVFTNILGNGTPDMSQRALNIGRRVEDVGMSPMGIAAMKAALAGETRRYSFSTPSIHFDVRVEPLRTSEGTICGALAVAFDVTARVRAEGEARASREELRRMAALMIDREEEQRSVLARDIHDEMGQRLTALRLELGLLAREVTSPTARALVESMSQLIRETADTVRRVAADLRPPMLDDFGFHAAIENELESFSRRTGIAASLSRPEREPTLEYQQMTALYRILQESLTNVSRHADATEVSVVFRADGGFAELEITDNGRGIRPEQAANLSSIGLAGIRERAYAQGGEATITGQPDRGTTVRVRLPLSRTPLRL